MKIESDFRKYRLSEVAKRNNLNKQRSRAMEQRIAKYLGGRRVPFSGAGGIKGDVLVNSSYGMYLIECKLSAGWDTHLDCESIILSFSWMDKIEEEVNLMRVHFGALVFHYHNVRADYIMMRADWFAILNPSIELNTVIVKETKTIRLPIISVRGWLETAPYIFIKRADKLYAVMDIDYFKAFMTEGE